jgi:hypothetical protein
MFDLLDATERERPNEGNAFKMLLLFLNYTCMREVYEIVQLERSTGANHEEIFATLERNANYQAWHDAERELAFICNEEQRWTRTL